MRKSFVFLFCMVVTMATVFAQADYKPATEEQQKELMRKITESSEQMKSLQCDFEQKKIFSILAEELISEGSM